MQCQPIGLWLCRWAALASLVCLLAGCEVDSANQQIEIHPDSAILKYGESVSLSALNGYIYHWSLSDSTLGALNTYQGQQVIYTSLSDPAAPVVQVVTVTSTFYDNIDTNASGSNAPTIHTGEAYITHINSSNNPWASE